MRNATDGLFARNQKREVRIHTFISYATLVLAPQISAFRRLHPGIGVQLTTSVWTDTTDDDAMDLEIRFGHGDWNEKDIRRLGHHYAHAVCHPDLPHRSEATCPSARWPNMQCKSSGQKQIGVGWQSISILKCRPVQVAQEPTLR